MLHEPWYIPWLAKDERVLWQGRPEADKCFDASGRQDGAPMIFMLAWGGFMLYKLCSGANVPVPVLIGGGVMIGVWLLIAAWTGFGRTLLAMHQLRDTEYVITSRRILRRTGAYVDGLDSRSMGQPWLKRGRENTGSIYFGKNTPDLYARYARHPSLAVAERFVLWGIPDAENVLALIGGMDKAASPVKCLSDRIFIPLEADERVLWQGRPVTKGLGITFRMHVNGDRWVGGVWATLAGLAVAGMLIWAHVPWEAWVLCTPFWGVLAYGLYCLGVFSLRIQRQMNDENVVVTNRRVLRQVGGRVKAYTIGKDDVIFLARGREGCGMVVIGDLQAARRRAERTPRRFSLADCPGFQLRSIPDPAAALDALHTLIPAKEEDTPCTT